MGTLTSLLQPVNAAEVRPWNCAEVLLLFLGHQSIKISMQDHNLRWLKKSVSA